MIEFFIYGVIGLISVLSVLYFSTIIKMERKLKKDVLTFEDKYFNPSKRRDY